MSVFRVNNQHREFMSSFCGIRWGLVRIAERIFMVRFWTVLPVLHSQLDRLKRWKIKIGLDRMKMLEHSGSVKCSTRQNEMLEESVEIRRARQIENARAQYGEKYLESEGARRIVQQNQQSINRAGP